LNVIEQTMKADGRTVRARLNQTRKARKSSYASDVSWGKGRRNEKFEEVSV